MPTPATRTAPRPFSERSSSLGDLEARTSHSLFLAHIPTRWQRRSVPSTQRCWRAAAPGGPPSPRWYLLMGGEACAGGAPIPQEDQHGYRCLMGGGETPHVPTLSIRRRAPVPSDG